MILKKCAYKSRKIEMIGSQLKRKPNMDIYLAIVLALCTTTQVFSEKILTLENDQEWPRCESGGTYNLPDSTYCDRFFICSNGNVYLSQCDDGLAYVPYQGCALLNQVDCSTRPNLQTPTGSGNCPRLNGLFKDNRKCGQFFRCTNGTAVMDNCDPAFVFDDYQKICRHPTEEEKRECYPKDDLFVPPLALTPTMTVPATEAPVAPIPVISGGVGSQTPLEAAQFKCPVPGIYPFGDHARYPYPGNCHFYILCFKDGTLKVGGCPNGIGFNGFTANCDMSIRC